MVLIHIMPHRLFTFIHNKFALLWGETQKKIAYSYPRVTYSYPRVTYSHPKVTYSDPKVTHSDPTHLHLPPPASHGLCLAISQV